ncbi:MAG: phosphatidate cytidylyltransferase [Clostridia bacterium]|nr:phosphatidate cytidylyltransferase [Clostridia bacterium]
MNWSKLKVRLSSAAILIALLLLIAFAPPWVFTIAVCAVCLIVLHEIMVTFKQGTKRTIVAADYCFALLYMVPAFLKQTQTGEYVQMITVFFVMVLLIFSVLNHKEINFGDVCASLFLVIYSVMFLMPLSIMRHQENGLALVFLAFIGAWLPDTVAYFAGSLFGKRKLAPKISPNKTVAGAIGAVVGAVVAFMVYGIILSYMGFTVSFVRMLVLSLICGVVAQFGDLSASMMKRAYEAKDFGNLIPGHGGLLDRVDSLIFITPVVYYFIIYFPVI